MRFRSRVLLCALLSLHVSSGIAEIRVLDDAGRTVSLPKPAQRIVSLAPHVTEMLFAVDAGDRIVGAIEYSDYPEAAKKIPRIGSSAGLDLEAILGLRPDLIIVWKSGNPARQIERLQGMGIPIYISEPRRLEDIPVSLERMGRLVDTDSLAKRVANDFRARHESLRARPGARPPLKVFYQVLDPLLVITVNDRHMVSDILRLCGGENVFANLTTLAPHIELEAVLAANPDVILAGGTEHVWQGWKSRWAAWPQLRAVRMENLFFVPASVIHRHGPRLLQGAERVCDALAQARTRQ